MPRRPRHVRYPSRELLRAMDERNYPLVEMQGDDERPRKLYPLASHEDYIDALQNDPRLSASLPEPKEYWSNGQIEATTRASDKHAWRNEDFYYAFEHNGALVGGVFDGLGGHTGSERASRVAAAASHNFVKKHITERMRLEDSMLLLAESLHLGNAAVTLANRELGWYSDIATTAALASIHTHPDGSGRQYAAMAWIGDSRIYHIRNQKALYTSLDDAGVGYRRERRHSERAVQDFLERTSDSDDDYEERWADSQLEDAFTYRNIVGACLDGRKGRFVNIDTLDLEVGDTVALMTDGIHDNLTRSEIANLASVRDLLAAALARSRDSDHPRAKPDDMTLVKLNAVDGMPEIIVPPFILPNSIATGGLVQKNGAYEGNSFVCFTCGQRTPHWSSGSAGGCMYCNNALRDV